ncbi:hypothetical protein COEREDRAFT_90145 [Coemansia reversa NRRL 1564]|uniref:DNA polymerase n=1 Tax=Coemansia reversa (strain ATCC 12441 / NRRL 1564) TaxID=763665 RepID=A0A2G5B0S1_COERN|nr:hypothetical protein COEREDRAFT_90145 [Coemansia reversa NRRL 1564]|eukprot:PIA12613.1 hypothetical protein COEREDRAFT_90145 [Coemansia reversa NRRL 1564]
MERIVYSLLIEPVRKRLGMSEEEFNICPAVAQHSLVRMACDIADREEKDERERIEQEKREKEQERIAHEVEIAVEAMRARGMERRVGVSESEALVRFNRQREVFEVSSAFGNEQYPVLYLDGRVKGFRRETVYGFESRILEMVNRAVDLQEQDAGQNVQRSFYSYMMLYLWTESRGRGAASPVVTVFNNVGIRDRITELLNKFDEFIERIKEESSGYEYLYEGDKHAQVHFYYCMVTFPEPKDHKQWGKVLPVEKRQFFDIFTASDHNMNCVAQCSERIALKEHRLQQVRQCKTLDELKEHLAERLCILNFHHSTRSINDVVDYTDLVIAKDSPCRNYSVIDTSKVYMVQFNGHVGLLENFKEQKRKRYYTTFRPLVRFPHCQRVTVCFDIECYFDPHNDQNHIPYLACCCLCYDDVPGNVVEFTGKDCVASMIDYVADICKQMDHKEVELIAHNGGGYDFHYLLSSMPDPSVVKNILIRNNNFIGFKFNHRDIQFSVKDSLHFLTCSLSKAAHSFLEESDRKTDFPHHEVLTSSDLERQMQEWLNVDLVVSANVEKERMFITSKHVMRYVEDGPSRKIIDWALEYCRNDVIVLAKVWIAFKRTVHTIFKCPIVDNTYTLAGMSFRLLEAFMPAEMLMHPPKDDFINMRAALVGGRCISMNGLYHDVACLDVKSLYPAAMAQYPQPHGQYRKVKSRPSNELGIYHVKVFPRFTPYPSAAGASDNDTLSLLCKDKAQPTDDENGFFPLRTEGGVTYKSAGVRGGATPCWYTTVDIDIGIEEGHTIEYIPFDDDKNVGYSWRKKDFIFTDYITDTLYRLKLKYEQAGDAEKRHVIKIIMNSLWGKFAQKWMDTQYKIVNEENVVSVGEPTAGENEAYKIWDTHHMLVKSHKNKVLADKPVQNGVFVLSWARHHMKQLWHKCIKPGTKCLYSDTDSMFVHKDTIIQDSLHIGDQMGQLELECTFDTFICVGKKQYIGSYYDSNGKVKYKKRFKGVPQAYIQPDLFSHLLESPDNTAQIDFLKFSREWGVVRGYIESKTVTAT